MRINQRLFFIEILVNVLITVPKNQFVFLKNTAQALKLSFLDVLYTILKIISNKLDYIISKPLIDKNEVKEIKSHLQSDFG